MNNLAPMKNCPGGGGGVQGNLNWMPGYCGLFLPEQIKYSSTHRIKSQVTKKFVHEISKPNTLQDFFVCFHA